MEQHDENAGDAEQGQASGEGVAPAKQVARIYRGGSVTAALAALARPPGMATDLESGAAFESQSNIPAIDRYEDPEGDKHVEQAITRKNFKPGSTMTAKDGVNYTIKRVSQRRGTLTLERTFPKVKGKAAKKALKKQQRAARASIARIATADTERQRNDRPE